MQLLSRGLNCGLDSLCQSDCPARGKIVVLTVESGVALEAGEAEDLDRARRVIGHACKELIQVAAAYQSCRRNFRPANAQVHAQANRFEGSAPAGF